VAPKRIPFRSRERCQNGSNDPAPVFCSFGCQVCGAGFSTIPLTGICFPRTLGTMAVNHFPKHRRDSLRCLAAPLDQGQSLSGALFQRAVNVAVRESLAEQKTRPPSEIGEELCNSSTVPVANTFDEGAPRQQFGLSIHFGYL